MILHALDSYVLPSANTLGFEDLTESAFALLRNETVLCLGPTMHARYIIVGPRDPT